jgi:YebC/PmpR family DNA-binding regulatory protein
MSGHSKWKNIMHKKGKTDAQRAKVFTKVGREMAMIVKQGGPDPAVNSRLRDCIAKAKANNVPNDNIERIIKKASGGGESTEYIDIVYEGYGPAGTALIVETLTDNRNRTAGDVRHYFDKFGGNMGTTGSVSWQFERKGVIAIDGEELKEETIMEHIMESGADDYTVEDGIYEVICEPEAFSEVRDYFEEKGYSLISAEVEMVPSNLIELTDEEQIKNMQRLLEVIEDNDDVQHVWHNWGNQPEEDEE